MGIVAGFPKYVLFTLLSGVGFISMYLFGGTIVTFWNTFDQITSGNYVQALIEFYINSALPPSSIEEAIFQAILGSIVAGIFWFVAMAARGAQW